MLKRLILMVCVIPFVVVSFAQAGADGARVQGDLRITGPGNGLVFPDGSVQYKSAEQGPVGPQGLKGDTGPMGPPGPKGDTGPAAEYSVSSICAAISQGGMEMPAFCTTPVKFTMDWLRGKTYYLVWFGVSEVNGVGINDVPVVLKVVYGTDGIAVATGLRNSDGGTFPYGVTASGLLFSGSDTSEGNVIVPGSNSQYIKTYYMVNGNFDNVDLFFLDQAAAMAYASRLTGSIPR